MALFREMVTRGGLNNNPVAIYIVLILSIGREIPLNLPFSSLGPLPHPCVSPSVQRTDATRRARRVIFMTRHPSKSLQNWFLFRFICRIVLVTPRIVLANLFTD